MTNDVSLLQPEVLVLIEGDTAMARGSIKKRILTTGEVRYDVIVDFRSKGGGDRRQRKRTYTSKKEAQVSLAQWLTSINNGDSVDRTLLTVADLAMEWLEYDAKPKVKSYTWEGYSQTLRYIIKCIGDVRVQVLTPRMVEEFYASARREGRGARSMQLCHCRLSQVLDRAVRYGVVTRNV